MMKRKGYTTALIVMVMLCLMKVSAFAQTLPSGMHIFQYPSISAPVISDTPATAKPIGVGNVATGGDTLMIQVALSEFTNPIDVYFLLYLPTMLPDIYSWSGTSLQPFSLQSLSLGIWKQNISGSIDQSIFGELSLTGLDFPPGLYYLGLLVTPSGNNTLSDCYLWITDFEVPTPPPMNPPSNLTAEAISHSQINIAWQDNSDDETGFNVFRKTGQSGSYTKIDTVNKNISTYRDSTGLSPDTTYYYKVTSFNTTSESYYSNEVSATTKSVVPPSGDYDGVWNGTADFGTFSLDVNDGVIIKFSPNFIGYKCGNVTKGGGVTVSGKLTSITDSTFVLTVQDFSDILSEDSLTLSGEFKSNTTASGTFTNKENGTTCYGSWEASK